jgi:tetratricopeptide (TPR) repeat protein
MRGYIEGMSLRSLTLVLFLTLLTAPAVAGNEAIEKAIGDLSSPFLEAREKAVKFLADAGPAASGPLRAAYSKSDFRTKSLILSVFGAGHPTRGLSLVLGDLGCQDRGVIAAQRDLVTAVYREAAAFIDREVVDKLPPGDWEWEEGLRALPSRAPSAQAALLRLKTSESLLHRALFRRAQDLLAGVGKVREGLAGARTSEDPGVHAGAREMERLLIRYDVERAFFGIHLAGGGDGTYDGMFALVGEVYQKEGAVAIEVLFWILTDVTPPEEGVPSPPRQRYHFLAPLPLDMTQMGVRRRAAACLGDIAPATAAFRLEEYYETFAKDELDPYETPRQDVAHACAMLGEKGPLTEIVAEYEVKRRWLDKDDRSRLAASYARLGNFEKAVENFSRAIELERREWLYHYNLACALARLGRVSEALVSLETAVETGYGLDPSNLRWMERDGDLAAVRKTAGYQRLIEKLKARLR